MIAAHHMGMFRNLYDSDAQTFSPQGRIHQIEYALEAVKQGSASVGLKSDTAVVLVALKRSQSELASHQKKLIPIDAHLGISISGLMSDARVLSTFMRTSAMQERMVYKRNVPIAKIARILADKAQKNTILPGRRPYGVGLLIAGMDKSGPHLYEFSPAGNSYDYLAVAIGSRSQSAKTYLERHYQKFPTASLDDLIVHGLKALRESLQSDKPLTEENCSVGVVSADRSFEVLEGERLTSYLAQVPQPTQIETSSGNDGADAMQT